MTEAKMVVRDRRIRFVDVNDPRERIDRAGQIPDFPDEAAERAWWSEHTLSEEFWRTAEPVPDSDLPPSRADSADSAGPASSTDRGGLALSSAFLAGFVTGGLIAAGIFILAFQRFLDGTVPGAQCATPDTKRRGG